MTATMESTHTLSLEKLPLLVLETICEYIAGDDSRDRRNLLAFTLSAFQGMTYLSSGFQDTSP